MASGDIPAPAFWDDYVDSVNPLEIVVTEGIRES
jgi:hypothetical protein